MDQPYRLERSTMIVFVCLCYHALDQARHVTRSAPDPPRLTGYGYWILDTDTDTTVSGIMMDAMHVRNEGPKGSRPFVDLSTVFWHSSHLGETMARLYEEKANINLPPSTHPSAGPFHAFKIATHHRGQSNLLHV